MILITSLINNIFVISKYSISGLATPNFHFRNINYSISLYSSIYFYMIQSATFSMEESQNILKTFLIDYDISKVIEKFVKRQPIHLREHIKRIIRETIINIEAHLFKAGKIPSLLLYDNQSDQMFEAFMNLKDIIPQSQKDNFYLNFENMKSEGCRIMRYGRTDYHVSINSQQRQRIYARFISYTEHYSLYKYAITRKDQDSNIESAPYGDPYKLFSARDLEFVFKAYCAQKGDISRMAKYFRSKGALDPCFQVESLEQSIPNLMLIGYYFAHKKSAEMGQTQLIRWAQFRQKYPLPEQSDFKAKVIWMRIAIRQDPQLNELRWIQRIQKKKVVTHQIKRASIPKKGPNLDHKKWRKGKQSVMSVIKKQIEKSIIHGKQQDLQSNDGQSIKSRYSSSYYAREKQRRQVQKQNYSKLVPPPEEYEQDEDSFEEQRLSKRERQPEFIEKIQKQNEHQKIIEEREEKDVVWEEIPDKSSSNIQESGNLSGTPTPSAKFYSQKPNHDRPSKQPSLRSFQGKPVKALQVQHRAGQKRESQIFDEQSSSQPQMRQHGLQRQGDEENQVLDDGEDEFESEISDEMKEQSD